VKSATKPIQHYPLQLRFCCHTTSGNCKSKFGEITAQRDRTDRQRSGSTGRTVL